MDGKRVTLYILVKVHSFFFILKLTRVKQIKIEIFTKKDLVQSNPFSAHIAHLLCNGKTLALTSFLEPQKKVFKKI